MVATEKSLSFRPTAFYPTIARTWFSVAALMVPRTIGKRSTPLVLQEQRWDLCRERSGASAPAKPVALRGISVNFQGRGVAGAGNCGVRQNRGVLPRFCQSNIQGDRGKAPRIGCTAGSHALNGSGGAARFKIQVHGR